MLVYQRAVSGRSWIVWTLRADGTGCCDGRCEVSGRGSSAARRRRHTGLFDAHERRRRTLAFLQDRKFAASDHSTLSHSAQNETRMNEKLRETTGRGHFSEGHGINRYVGGWQARSSNRATSSRRRIP
jgi:hypothetical protein